MPQPPKAAKPALADTPAPEITTPPPITSSAELAPFIWQQLNDIQSRIGALTSGVENQTAAIDKLDSRHEALKEKVHSITITIAVAGAIAAVIGSIALFLLKEVYDVAKPLAIQRLPAESAAPAAPAKSASRP